MIDFVSEMQRWRELERARFMEVTVDRGLKLRSPVARMKAPSRPQHALPAKPHFNTSVVTWPCQIIRHAWRPPLSLSNRGIVGGGRTSPERKSVPPPTPAFTFKPVLWRLWGKQRATIIYNLLKLFLEHKRTHIRRGEKEEEQKISERWLPISFFFHRGSHFADRTEIAKLWIQCSEADPD